MLLHPLKNFEKQMYYQNERKFNGAYSTNCSLKIKFRAYVINVHECNTLGTHGVVILGKNNAAIYFDSFWNEHIRKETKRFIGNKNITTNIYKVQTYHSTKCG